MKILFTTEFFIQRYGGEDFAQAGGGERKTFEITKALAKLGHNINVLCHEHIYGVRGELYKNFYIHRLGIHTDIWNYLRRIYYVFDLFRYRSLFKQADIINTSMFIPAIPSYYLARIYRKPITIMVDDIFTFDIASGNLPLYAAVATLGIENLIVKLDFDAVIVPTRYIKSKLINFGFNSDVYVVNNGVDLEFYKGVEEPETRDQLIIISRLVPYKGVHHVVDVYYELKKRIWRKVSQARYNRVLRGLSTL